MFPLRKLFFQYGEFCEWALFQLSRMLSGAQGGAVSGKVISE